MDRKGLTSIHRFKGLNKGCVLYTGASYTREITVVDKCLVVYHIKSTCCQLVDKYLLAYDIKFTLCQATDVSQFMLLCDPRQVSDVFGVI